MSDVNIKDRYINAQDSYACSWLFSYISLKDVSGIIFFESWIFTGLFCSFHDNSSITSWELPEFQPCACDCKVVLNLKHFSTNQFCLAKRWGQLQGCLTLSEEMVLQICVVEMTPAEMVREHGALESKLCVLFSLEEPERGTQGCLQGECLCMSSPVCNTGQGSLAACQGVDGAVTAR